MPIGDIRRLILPRRLICSILRITNGAGFFISVHRELIRGSSDFVRRLPVTQTELKIPGVPALYLSIYANWLYRGILYTKCSVGTRMLSEFHHLTRLHNLGRLLEDEKFVNVVTGALLSMLQERKKAGLQVLPENWIIDRIFDEAGATEPMSRLLLELWARERDEAQVRSNSGSWPAVFTRELACLLMARRHRDVRGVEFLKREDLEDGNEVARVASGPGGESDGGPRKKRTKV